METDGLNRITLAQNRSWTILIYDIEQGILTGKIRRSWPREGKYELIGSALDGRSIGVVCRITTSGKVRIITVYEDRSGE
ncbi:MAG: DUF4258 domain-containing protein [Syntrophobacteraceae bacterium]